MKQKQSSLLSRQSDLEQLDKQIKLLNETIVDLKRQNDEQQIAIDKLLHDKNTVQQDGTNNQLMERELSIAIEQQEKQLATMSRQIEVLTMDKTAIEQEISNTKAVYTTSSEQLKQVIKQVDDSRLLMSKMNASQEERATQAQDVQKLLHQESADLAVLKEQDQTLTQTIAQLVQQEKDVTLSIEALKTAQTESQYTRDELTEQLSDITEQLKTAALEQERIEQMLSVTREEKKDIDVALVFNDAQLSEVHAQLQSFLKEQGTLNGRLERYHVTIDTHLERLAQEYELSYEAAKQQANLDMPIGQASDYVTRLKREIEQLGPVNLTAIDEFDQVSERHRFMSEQQSDLLQAKGQLINTMTEMDSEVEKRFSETFFAIKQQFEKTFPRLFGGGRATLELTDPTNLLETGIDIIAQPPGKRLQNLSLLSGGERAFTAIALLFAILEIKPVPFCLLDEVEAALDEANVGRYGRYLKSFTDTTQFIVITHRKGTMEEADVLYGVTMQESGVSKLASVKLENYKEEIPS